MADGAVYLSDVGFVRIDIVMALLGNFSERTMTPYTLGIDSSLVIVDLHGFTMTGRTVNGFSCMDICKAPTCCFHSCLFWLKSVLPSRLPLRS
jgi:uncharacterized membrane protein YuzA (DUF378 family)